MEHKIMLQAMLYTGMRYIEMIRFQYHPMWFDGDFIHLPEEAVHKQLRLQKERWVRLNNQGKMMVKFFLEIHRAVPTSQSWNMNIKAWGRKAGLDPEGLCVKTTRKTWESWLIFSFPTRIMDITLSQGHTQVVSLQHYMNMPFTEIDRIDIKEFVQGWINGDGRQVLYRVSEE
jgi:integrase